jgi:hypothetical protein
MTTIRQFSPVRVAILLLLAVVSAGPLAACYTLVQHPRVASLYFRRPPEGKSCTDCHRTEELHGFLRPANLSPETPPWDALADPWWIPPDSTGGDG